MTATSVEAVPSTILEGVARRVRPRDAAKTVRDLREVLASTTGLKPAFDVELMRQYAHKRVGASFAIMVLALCIAVAGSLWSTSSTIWVWFFCVLSSHFAGVALCQRFLALPPPQVPIQHWRQRLTFAETANSLVWSFSAFHLAHLGGGSGAVGLVSVLFVMLLLVAVTTMLSATLPPAMYGGTVPVTLVAVGLLLYSGFQVSTDDSGVVSTSLDATSTAMAAMALGALAYFLMLGKRLHTAMLESIISKAEKDALIGELEQAKAISDEAARRAEEASAAKSRFLATMSHELRTPLNAILGFSEVMKSEVFGPLPNLQYKEYAGDIHSSCQHLLNLINEILDLSRIEAGRFDLQEEAVDLMAIVEDCHHLLKLRAKTKNITISENFELDMPRLWADERALRQIALNLLSNAIKFTPPGGEVFLKVGWTLSGGEYFSVRDTGPGIPEDEIPTVLQSFGRGTLAIKTAEQGTGLGLPIVKRLVDLHGGNFTLRSKLREGTEVIVTFPGSRVMEALAPMDMESAADAR